MDEQAKQELIQANEARAAFARMLASLYLYELTAEEVERLAGIPVAQDGTTVTEGFAHIKEYLRHRDAGTVQELKVDYAHTFLGAGTYDKIMAPPYESVFTSEGQLLMQDARDGALAYYRLEWLDLPEGNTTPEDHLGFELQFAAELACRSTRALQEGDEERHLHLMQMARGFFSYHLQNWLPSFCDAVETHCKTAFYRGVSYLTRGYVESEQEFFDELALEVGLGDSVEVRPLWADEPEDNTPQSSVYDAIREEAAALGAALPRHE